MTELDEDFFYDDSRPSKAALRRQAKRDMEEEIEDFGDFYPEYLELLKKVRL